LRTTINEANDEVEFLEPDKIGLVPKDQPTGPGLVTLFKKHSDGLDLNQLIADKKRQTESEKSTQ
jgi:hypothetical protein